MNETPKANAEAMRAVEEAITGTRLLNEPPPRLFKPERDPRPRPRQASTTRRAACSGDRGKVHGDFGDNAVYAQDLKKILHESHNWRGLTPIQTEALEMIVHKIARILSGDPNHKDHWADIQGYARLVETRLK